MPKNSPALRRDIPSSTAWIAWRICFSLQDLYDFEDDIYKKKNRTDKNEPRLQLLSSENVAAYLL